MTAMNHTKDQQLVVEAARAILSAINDGSFDHACKNMVEALRQTRSLSWWDELDIMVEDR